MSVLDASTGLNRHAWDENRDMFWSNDTTGLSQHCWGRAQGWYVMALVGILDAPARGLRGAAARWPTCLPALSTEW